MLRVLVQGARSITIVSASPRWKRATLTSDSSEIKAVAESWPVLPRPFFEEGGPAAAGDHSMGRCRPVGGPEFVDMAPFPFLQRERVAEHARDLQLKRYTPQIELEGLVTGIDNLRHDVYLSPQFAARARQHVAALIAKYGRVEDMAVAPPEAPSGPNARFLRPAPAPGQHERPPEPPDFKRSLSDLLVAGLNRAKAEGNISVDVLLRLATLKFLRVELAAQFAVVLERCRAKVAGYEGPQPGPEHQGHRIPGTHGGLPTGQSSHPPQGQPGTVPHLARGGEGNARPHAAFAFRRRRAVPRMPFF